MSRREMRLAHVEARTETEEPGEIPVVRVHDPNSEGPWQRARQRGRLQPCCNRKAVVGRVESIPACRLHGV
jgi:hypothetical protein